MKGSHSVEGFLNWLRYAKVSNATKVGLSHKIHKMADLCSATGKQGRVEFKLHENLIMIFRVFDDGSLEVGVPEGAKWPQMPPFIPPPEKEM